MPSKYTPPNAVSKRDTLRSERGHLSENRDRDRSTGKPGRALAQGKKVLLEATEENSQEKNPAAWYYLGRIYLQEGDIVGADTCTSPRPRP